MTSAGPTQLSNGCCWGDVLEELHDGADVFLEDVRVIVAFADGLCLAKHDEAQMAVALCQLRQLRLARASGGRLPREQSPAEVGDEDHGR